MDAPALTLRDIAREMNLPESTIRYYRDSFAAYIPTVGLGRRRRYPGEAIEIFRAIAQGYAQNWTREDIEARLAEIAPPVEAVAQPLPPPRPAMLRLHRQAPMVSHTNDDVVTSLIEGERERRDVMWQLAREIVRMGEALERQQVTLMQLTQQLDNGHRTLPPGAPVPVPYGGASVPAAPAPDQTDLAKELAALRDELQRERELVERLRRSKLDIERRASVAEAELQHRAAESADLSAIRRFLGKDPR